MPKYRFEEIVINSTEKKKPVEEDKYTYLGLEHLDSGSLKVKRFGSDVAPVGEKLIMHKGDVLFGKRRAYQKKVAIAPFDGIFSAHGMVLRPKENVIDKSFFPLFISSDYFLDAAIEISVGSLSPTINWKDLKNLEFNLPDLRKQSELAEVLWAINDVLDNYKNLLSLTDRLCKSQFIEMFYDRGYPVMKMGELLNQLTKTERITDTTAEKYVTVALYGKGVRERNIDIYDPKPFTGYRVKAGQFIYSRIDARNGAFGVIPESLDGAVVSKDFPVFEVDHSKVSDEILLFSLQDANFIQQIKKNSMGTTNRQRIKEEVFLNYSIVVPPMEKQKAFESFIKQTDKSKFELESTLEQLKATYKRILIENLG